MGVWATLYHYSYCSINIGNLVQSLVYLRTLRINSSCTMTKSIEIWQVVFMQSATLFWFLTFPFKLNQSSVITTVSFIQARNSCPLCSSFLIQDFKRDGSDLHMVQRIGLVEALCGFQMTIAHLDGRQLLVKYPAGKVIEPGECELLLRIGRKARRKVNSNTFLCRLY